MNDTFIVATIMAAVLVSVVYTATGWKKIIECYSLWFTSEYWKPYNIIEAASWLAKALIIIPGLIFGLQIWWLHIFTLLTSLTLIWASNKKLLPTLVGFNTLWVWLSSVIIVDNILK